LGIFIGMLPPVKAPGKSPETHTVMTAYRFLIHYI